MPLPIVSKVRLLITAAILLIVIGSGMGYWAWRPHPQHRTSHQRAIYVWQEAWSPEVIRSIERAAQQTDHLMVFAAEIRLKQNQLAAARKHFDWSALARAARPVTLVIRADDRVVGLLASDQGNVRLSDCLLKEAGDLLAVGRGAGVDLAGVQLDFDCPTSRLDQYRRLLKTVQPALTKMEFSITALPTWLQSRQFRSLVRDLSYFVLQVHAIKAPRTIQGTVRLVELDRLGSWLKQAAAAGVPFYVALPTYGYRLFFDREGACTGFWAEGPPAANRAGMQTRVVSAQPEELAPIVLGLKERPPRHFQGIIWFRLPVAGDTLNWAWPTLQAVMAGRAPQISFAAELRRPTPGLFEVWVTNTGESSAHGRLVIPVNLGPARPLARDALSGWRWAADGSSLEGPAPPLGEPRMVAWFRLHAKTQDQLETITLGKVEIAP